MTSEQKAIASKIVNAVIVFLSALAGAFLGS